MTDRQTGELRHRRSIMFNCSGTAMLAGRLHGSLVVVWTMGNASPNWKIRPADDRNRSQSLRSLGAYGTSRQYPADHRFNLFEGVK